MSSYKITLRNGEECKVRFYPSGIFTITDKRGEHEVGMWKKEKHQYRGKWYDSGGYNAMFFDDGKTVFDFRQRELAWRLLRWFLFLRRR